MSKTQTTRRKFMKSAAVATAAFSVVPRHVIGGKGFVAPSEKVNVAIVGAGGMGMRNARALLHEPDAQVVAVCDIADQTDLRPYWYRCFAGRNPTKEMVEKHYSEGKPNYKCAAYEDFRVMLEKEKGIDAVLCASPDHTHAFISIMSMKEGKHVYCEKPLAHSVYEVRRMAEVAKETGVATQMGNHRHSGSGIRMTCEWIWDGVIGDIREVHAWNNSTLWYKEGRGRPQGTPPVPDGFNWDLWLGPRPERPYHPAYAPYVWRAWWEFGTGSLGNVGTHYMDPPAWALDLYNPTSVEGIATDGCDSEVAANGAFFTFRFPARGKKPPVTMTWYDGGLRPPHPDIFDADDPQQKLEPSGVLFVGEKGCLRCNRSDLSPMVLPLDLHKSYKRPEPTIPRTKGHHAEWLTACKGGPAASSNFANSAPLTEMVLLGNVALRTGRKILWDAKTMRATNVPEADQYLKESCRPGWEV